MQSVAGHWNGYPVPGSKLATCVQRNRRFNNWRPSRRSLSLDDYRCGNFGVPISRTIFHIFCFSLYYLHSFFYFTSSVFHFSMQYNFYDVQLFTMFNNLRWVFFIFLIFNYLCELNTTHFWQCIAELPLVPLKWSISLPMCTLPDLIAVYSTFCSIGRTRTHTQNNRHLFLLVLNIKIKDYSTFHWILVTVYSTWICIIFR